MTSIRRQLTRELLAAFLLMLCAALAALYFANRVEIIEQFDATLYAKALAISSLTSLDDGKIRVDYSDGVFRSFLHGHPRDYFEIFDGKGAVLAQSDNLGSKFNELPRIGPRPRYWNVTLPDGRSGRALGGEFRLAADGEGMRPDTPSLYFVVASDRGELDEALYELLGIGSGSALILAGVTWWLVPRVLRRGLRPLDQLGEKTARIDANSLTTRLPGDNLPAELQPIARSLNELLARLEVSFERERRFGADLAHELRTPLAELRSLAECSLKWPETRDGATDQEILAIATQMQRIVTSLLALVRGETLAAQPPEPVALESLAREAWHPFEERAKQRNLKVTWDGSPVVVFGDAALLRSILTNLLENATDYATEGGLLAVRIEAGADTATLHVSNSTDNLSQDDVTKMFDRFWRKEEARTGGRHFGLGLSLSRMFAHAMGWSLTASLDRQGLLEFALSGPAVKSVAAIKS